MSFKGLNNIRASATKLRLLSRTYLHQPLGTRHLSTSTHRPFSHSTWLKVSVGSILGASGLVYLFENRGLPPSDVAVQLEQGPADKPVVHKSTHEKPRLVVLGSGWGAISLLKELDKDKYDVTVVSPNNYFLFTPLLPSATVGTLELRSLLEPVRKISKQLKALFLQAKAKDIQYENKLVLLEGIDGTEFYLPYDKLVIAVGSQSMTFGVEGMEYCSFLKNIEDARELKQRILDSFERAALPTTSEKEKERLLSFVVCGGGPTGVEFAAELYDFVEEDLINYFPADLKDKVQITVIQSRDHILNTYDEKISQYTENHFKRSGINVITLARVKSVHEDHIVYSLKQPDGSLVQKTLPFGVCLWSTGISMTPLTKQLCDSLKEQKNKRALETDNRLRVKGIADGSIYAIGDCSTLENPHLVDHIMEIFEAADLDNSGTINFEEFREMTREMSIKYPCTRAHLLKLHELFDKYDEDKSGELDLDELNKLLQYVDSKLTSLPATAQVASQQGKYLAQKFNTLADNKSQTDDDYPPFLYSHLGSLAYIGGSAVADFGKGHYISGFGAVYLWRSIYWSEQVSTRTRLLLSMDWTKRALFGRDLSKI
ncbi:nucleotide-binding domain-containing protein [Basidiobolus meristosporus CBS 931.73]|uniref:Nucleotide-binding domain-containing protein n=1 Tax=Basidiobolus meristosporus CBS 931.73 TaxID=1314790 RepID=A0A1Y1XYE5_9FUNG|nr:nucleotide-binding domain-containing protein [Basidiobolus meristosporus CBS 931.73]|eukprot:ORX90768.1 nucleotide-binding domain-containing protein [Basidiobolus meristosporus CBS 931.73]